MVYFLRYIVRLQATGIEYLSRHFWHCSISLQGIVFLILSSLALKMNGVWSLSLLTGWTSNFWKRLLMVNFRHYRHVADVFLPRTINAWFMVYQLYVKRFFRELIPECNKVFYLYQYIYYSDYTCTRRFPCFFSLSGSPLVRDSYFVRTQMHRKLSRQFDNGSWQRRFNRVSAVSVFAFWWISDVIWGPTVTYELRVKDTQRK